MIFIFSRSTRGFMHMRICRGTEGYTLGGAATAFPTVPALMKHYVTAQRLPVRGAEHMALSTPLPAVLLWTFHGTSMESFDAVTASKAGQKFGVAERQQSEFEKAL